MPPKWLSGYNPPVPLPSVGNDGDTSGGSEKEIPQQFLALVRLVEKQDSRYEVNTEKLVELLNFMISLYSRRGLLQGNVTRAQRILSSSTTAGKKKSSNSRDRSHSSNKKSNDLLIHTATVGGEEKEEGSSEEPISEILIFTALARILADSKEDGARRSILDADSVLLIALAAELCVAMSQCIQTRNDDGNICSLAEYELLAQSGKPLLSGLVAKVRLLDFSIRKDSSEGGGLTATQLEPCLAMAHFLDEDKHVAPTLSCLRAACSFVTLFGTKLSRSTVLLADLKSIAWQFIACPNHSLQAAAARLLAALPLAGGTDRKTPSELWNIGQTNCIGMLHKLVDTVGPVTTTSGKREYVLSEDADVALQRWIAFLRHDVSADLDRVHTFRWLLQGLVLAFQHSLYRDCFGHTPGLVVEASIDIEMSLELTEKFLSYPMSAESLFFRTKKRLRDEAVEGGLISARTISTEVANEVKRLGHDIMDCLISSIGGPALLPLARRIIRISYAALLTSCSGAVRKIMDPASSVQLEGKKRRWLHLSIPLRAKAVRTVQLVTVAFGSDRTAKVDTSERGDDSKSDGEMAITLVGGCLFEQIGEKEMDNCVEETWGQLDERVDLINACFDCLRGALSSCQGFLGFATRSMIDSLVAHCLSRSTSATTGNPLGWSSVQCRLFQLASTCVATPWNDGSSTSIVQLLKRAAVKSCIESDEAVASAAKDALCVCDLYGIPRAPPLLFVHRTLVESSMRMEETAPKIMDDIQAAQLEAVQARQALEQAEQAKLQEKRQREVERKDSNSKRKKILHETKNEPKEDTSTKASINVDVTVAEDPSTVANDDVSPKRSNEESKATVTERILTSDEADRPKETSKSSEKVDLVDHHDIKQDTIDHDDDDFPEIDIVADGPDSDDD